MNSRLARVFVAAAVIGLTVTFAAAAAPVGREAPITKELATYFSGFGVDPQYLGVPADKVPADQAAKIEAVLGLQDDKTNGLYPYTTLTRLVQEALNAAVDLENDPVYVEILDHSWQKELGRNPINHTGPAPLTAAEASWVPIG